MTKDHRSDDYFLCPHCGAEVARGKTFCRECGASEAAGWGNEDNWSDEQAPAGYGEDDDFDYEEFIAREFPGTQPQRIRLKQWALLLLVLLLCGALLVFLW